MGENEVTQRLIKLLEKQSKRLQEKSLINYVKGAMDYQELKIVYDGVIRCMDELKYLEQCTKELNGFCSNYPKEAGKQLKIMKTIIEMELQEKGSANANQPSLGRSS